MENVFVSWSGGKDCCLALHRALENGYKVKCLASMMTEKNGRLWPHYLKPEILEKQAEAIGLPLVQHWTDVEHYAEEYKKMLSNLKERDIDGGIFGDVSEGNTQAGEHLKWVDNVCKPAGITPHRLLWHEPRESLILDLLDNGYKVVIIAADRTHIGKKWLGRTLNRELLEEMKKRYEESPTGEVGFYHTFVVDGPTFEKRLEIGETDIVFNEIFWFLDIKEVSLIPKLKITKALKNPPKLEDKNPNARKPNSQHFAPTKHRCKRT